MNLEEIGRKIAVGEALSPKEAKEFLRQALGTQSALLLLMGTAYGGLDLTGALNVTQEYADAGIEDINESFKAHGGTFKP